MHKKKAIFTRAEQKETLVKSQANFEADAQFQKYKWIILLYKRSVANKESSHQFLTY